MLQFNRARSSGRAAHVGDAGPVAIGEWWMDTTTAAGSVATIIPNAVSSNPVIANMIPFPRRNFSNLSYATNNATVVDNNAVGPDGLTEASTVTQASGEFWVSSAPFANGVIAAGTYTHACWVRWKGTGVATFQLGAYNTQFTSFTPSDTLWHRYSAQFVSNGTGAVWPMFHGPGGGSAAFEICDMNLFAGSSDLGTVGADTHIIVTKKTTTGAQWSVSGGHLDAFTAGGIAALSVPTQTLSTGFTLMYLAQPTSNYNSSSFTPILSTNSFNYTDFALGGVAGGNQALAYNGGNLALNGGGLAGKVGDGYSVGAITYDGTTVRIYHNGAQIGEAAASISAATIRDFTIGALQAATYFSGHRIAALGLYASALTKAQVESKTATMAARVLANSSIALGSFYEMTFDGDSITQGVGDASPPGGFAYRVGLISTTPAAVGWDYGVSSSQVSGLVSRASKVDDTLPLNKNGKKYALHIYIGTNDLGLGNSAAFLTALGSYLDARRTAGWDYIIVGTLMDKSASLAGTQAQYWTDRDAANAQFAAWVGTKIDALADYRNDALTKTVAGDQGTSTNTTYFGDGVHPTATLHALMAQVSLAARASLP